MLLTALRRLAGAAPPPAPAPIPVGAVGDREFSPATWAAAGLARPFPLAELVAVLRREEGCRLTVYDDATGKPIGPGSVVMGHPTIGIGRALNRRGISQAEAEAMLARDVAELVEQVPKLPALSACWPNLAPARRLVLVAMAFQMGLEGLAGFRNTLALVAAGRYAEAADGMMQSLWARQTPARAGRMADIMRRGALP